MSSTANTFGSRLNESSLLKGKYYALLLFGVVATMYHLWFAYTLGIAMDLHLVVHVWTMLCMAALYVFDPSVTRDDGLWSVIDNYLVIPLEILLASVTSYYMFTNYQRLYIEALGVYSTLDVAMGAILVFLVIDLSRRTFGWVIAGVAVVGLFYATTASYWPGVMQTRGIPPMSLIAGVTVQFTGLYDLIVRVSATYIIIFLLFAGFLESYGALEYFIKIGAKIGSKVRSGVTQAAVIASMGMGSVNGSAAANAATTGAMTIPLMKSQGVNDDTAGGIEAVASSGGQIMPPVMGAAAFLMVEIIGTSYLRIITIALLPALLFYLSVVVAVFLMTDKEGAASKGIDEDSVKEIDTHTSMKELIESVSIGSSSTPDLDALTSEEETKKPWYYTLAEGFYLWGPVSVLVYTLVILQWSALTAGLYACLATIVCAFIQYIALGDDVSSSIRMYVADTFDGMRLGSQNSAAIAIAAASLAIFIEALSMTGFTLVLTNEMVRIAGGSLFILLFVAMIAAILFGLGMPTTGAYLVAVLLIAPSLTQLGLQVETAHFFVFYFAILSALTPPVAIANIITSEISGASFVSTCYKSLLIGAPLFILPYVFVVNPALLFWETPYSFILFGLLLIAMISISVSLISYFFAEVALPIRALLFVLGLAVLFTPLIPIGYNSIVLQAVGAVLLLAILLYQFALGTNRIGAPEVLDRDDTV